MAIFGEAAGRTGAAHPGARAAARAKAPPRGRRQRARRNPGGSAGAGGHGVAEAPISGYPNSFVPQLCSCSTRRARLGVENGWYTGERRVLKESVEIVGSPAAADRRDLDLTPVFEALERPLELRGEPSQKKGDGGLSFRFAPREGTVVRTEAGQEKADSNMAPHPWAELEGVFAGRRAGARVTIDPSHPGYPNGWCLRHYGFLGVNYPGLEALTLAPGQPLTLKYRVTVYGASQ